LHGAPLGFHKDSPGARQENTHAPARAFPVAAEDGERVVMTRLEEAYGVCIARGKSFCASVRSDR
jgi:hypothetical protein